MELFEWVRGLIADETSRGIGVGLASIVGIVAWVVLQWLIRLAQRAWCFLRSRRRTLLAVRREKTAAGAYEGEGVWRTRPILQPDNYSDLIGNLKVIAIANLKGGVGKTTLTANLGAYYAKEWGKRVLLIDLDFQGSLSSMAFPTEDWLPGEGESSVATQLISNDLRPNQVRSVARNVPLGEDARTEGRLDVITGHYDLAQADNRILVEWLLTCSRRRAIGFRRRLIELIGGGVFRTEDVRYRLALLLHSKPIALAYDIVIIDCPPRLTTSEIQALCASSHLLIPTILDRPSAQAVLSLHDQIETLKRAGVCPHLRCVGVAVTKWKGGLNVEREAIQSLEDSLRKRNALMRVGSDEALLILPEETFVRQTVQIVENAENGIAYLEMPEGDRVNVKDAIQKLAYFLASKVGLPHTPSESGRSHEAP